MGYYSKKNIEKKQWFVVKYKYFTNSISNKYMYIYTIYPDTEAINKYPLTLDEAIKFRDIINKLYNK